MTFGGRIRRGSELIEHLYDLSMVLAGHGDVGLSILYHTILPLSSNNLIPLLHTIHTKMEEFLGQPGVLESLYVRSQNENAHPAE